MRTGERVSGLDLRAELAAATDEIVRSWTGLKNPTKAELQSAVDGVLTAHKMPAPMVEVLFGDLFTRAPTQARIFNPSAADSAAFAQRVDTEAPGSTRGSGSVLRVTTAELARHGEELRKRFGGPASPHGAELSAVALREKLDLSVLLDVAYDAHAALSQHFDVDGIAALVDMAAASGAGAADLLQATLARGRDLAARCGKEHRTVFNQVNEPSIEAERVAVRYGGSFSDAHRVEQSLFNQNYNAGVSATARELQVETTVVARHVRDLYRALPGVEFSFAEALIATDLALRTGHQPAKVLPRVIALAETVFATRTLTVRDGPVVAGLLGKSDPTAPLSVAERAGLLQRAATVLAWVLEYADMRGSMLDEFKEKYAALRIFYGLNGTLSSFRGRHAPRAIAKVHEHEQVLGAVLTQIQGDAKALARARDVFKTRYAPHPEYAELPSVRSNAGAQDRLAALAAKNGMLPQAHPLLLAGYLAAHPTHLVGQRAAVIWTDFFNRRHVLEGQIVSANGGRPLVATAAPNGKPVAVEVRSAAFTFKPNVDVDDLRALAAERGLEVHAAVYQGRVWELHKQLEGREVVVLQATEDWLNLELASGRVELVKNQGYYALRREDGSTEPVNNRWVAVAFAPGAAA